MYQVKATEYPNGEIRLTTAKLRSPVSLLDSNETVATDPSSPFLTLGENSTPDLLPMEEKKKVGWGELPRDRVFSRRGRNKLLRSGGVFTKEDYKPQEVLFLTGTLPGSTQEAFREMSAWSGFLVWHLKNWINKYIPSKCDFYVWEHQKRGALHLHYAVHCPDREVGERIRTRFPSYWVGKLKEVSLASGVDLFDTGKGFSWLGCIAEKNQVAQWCEKDVSRYLAKYCSKSAASVTRNVKGNRYSPSQWYGVSRPLLALLRKHTVEHIYYAVKQGRARKMFEKLYGYLANLADVCHIYSSDVVGLPQCVAYNSHWNLTTLWLRTMTNNPLSGRTLANSLTSSEWLSSYLVVVAKRYRITPSFLLENSSPLSAQSLEKLYGLQSLNIAEAMDLIHALRWNSWYKFRSRSEPPLLQKDVEFLDKIYHRLLTLRIQTNASPEMLISEFLSQRVDTGNF